MTLRTLKKHAATWVTALRLSDWEIDLVFKPQAELEAKDSAGSSYWQTEYKTASIEIASDQPEEEVLETLIHELLHLALEGHKPLHKGYKYDGPYEFALNTLAGVLADKKKRRPRGTP